MNTIRSRFAAVSFFVILLIGCAEDRDTTDYRQRMRDFVIGISTYAKDQDAAFIVIPQNGQELLTRNGEQDGQPADAYLDAIDGVGREDLYFGYDEDNQPTEPEDIAYMRSFLDIAEEHGVEVLTTDYCSTPSKMDDSYKKNSDNHYLSFAADSRELDRIPKYPEAPYAENNSDIASLHDAGNFLYLLNPDIVYASKEDFLTALKNTTFDAFIIDAFFMDEPLTAADVAGLKIKPDGGTRLVICYMSIGEAEDYRFYWKADWNRNTPEWLAGENPAWPGNYKVRYWEDSWQSIIYGGTGAYLDRILAAGFSGVYLDIIDAFEYFENDGKWWYPY
jgi:cysteinyl-tRNA synthetase, unknown class